MKEDIVKEADRVINKLRESDGKLKLTTSQIRKFLAAVTDINNKVEVYKIEHLQEKQLSEKLAGEISFLKVKAAYQAGKEGYNSPVAKFIKEAQIMKRIDQIGRDIQKYEEFAHYIEALVAYHRFYGGREQ